MKAVQCTQYGAPEVLVPAEVDPPRPGPGEIAVTVDHAGVNFAEVMFRRGQFEIGVPHIPGLEAAGTVAELGEGVAGPAVDSRVAALTLAGGGYAETVVARADHTVRLDGDAEGMASATAAAFPCNVTVALGLLHDAARLTKGESVLVTGPAGGVGTAVAQLARRAGASAVYGVTESPQKAAYAREFGYDHVFAYPELREGLPELTGGRGVDVTLDSVGGPLREYGLDLLAPFGRHIVFGDASRRDAEFTGNGMWAASKAIGGYNLGAVAHAHPELVRDRLRQAASDIASGALRIDVTELPLEEAAKAHEALENRSSTGKYVLRVR